jgi:methylmalonyl-CoA mutase
MKHSLFSEFDPIPSKQWKQKIQFELKGEDYNDTLICF